MLRLVTVCHPCFGISILIHHEHLLMDMWIFAFPVSCLSGTSAVCSTAQSWHEYKKPGCPNAPPARVHVGITSSISSLLLFFFWLPICCPSLFCQFVSDSVIILSLNLSSLSSFALWQLSRDDDGTSTILPRPSEAASTHSPGQADQHAGYPRRKPAKRRDMRDQR